MNKVYRSSIILYTLLFCISGIVLHSCKDIQEIDQFLEKNIDVFVEKGKGIKMIYSDSAKIKMKLTAPEL